MEFKKFILKGEIKKINVILGFILIWFGFYILLIGRWLFSIVVLATGIYNIYFGIKDIKLIKKK